MVSASVASIPNAACKNVVLREEIIVYAGDRRERSSSANLFVSSFALGGIIVEIPLKFGRAVAGNDKKDLMRKLSKLIYDEEKALERERKELTENIAHLDTAIDEVSAQIHSDNAVVDDDLVQFEEVEVTW